MGHDGGGYSAVEYETEVLELDLMGQADVLHKGINGLRRQVKRMNFRFGLSIYEQSLSK